MDDSKKVSISELIELHIELKGDSEGWNAPEESRLLDENALPPRREIFPSKQPKLTRIFYNALFVLFLGLVIGLTVWGAKMN